MDARSPLAPLREFPSSSSNIFAPVPSSPVKGVALSPQKQLSSNATLGMSPSLLKQKQQLPLITKRQQQQWNEFAAVQSPLLITGDKENLSPFASPSNFFLSLNSP